MVETFEIGKHIHQRNGFITPYEYAMDSMGKAMLGRFNVQTII